jgi:MYXO-CTERM domain-containing protein
MSGENPHSAAPIKLRKETNMKLRPKSKLLIAAALGLAFAAVAAHAQLLLLNVNEKTTFGPFIGGINNNVTNNGSVNTTEVVTTGTPTANPFSITFNPLTGPNSVLLGTTTLDTSDLTFHSTQTPLNYFTSVQLERQTDFDGDGIYDLTQFYTLSLTPFTSANGLTGVNYSIVPQTNYGTVVINGTNYGYASVVSNNAGTLFDGSSTIAAVQFQFLASPVPEPSTYAIAGVLALGGIVALRRRRSNTGGLNGLAA